MHSECNTNTKTSRIVVDYSTEKLIIKTIAISHGVMALLKTLLD